MKLIPLTQGKFAQVDDEDFEWISKWKWFFHNKGYAARGAPRNASKKRQLIMMHRVIINTPKGLDTDHKNRNRLDNTKENLRLATRSENLYNSKVRCDNKLKMKGVYKKQSKYLSRISENGKRVVIGLFDTPEAAHEAYQDAASRLHGEFFKV